MSQIKNFYFGLSNVILNIRSFDHFYKNYSLNEISEGGARVCYCLNLQNDEMPKPKVEKEGISKFILPGIEFNSIDIAVLDSIYTMYKNGKMIFTIDELLDVVFVCQNAHGDDEYNQMVSKSIDKLLKIKMTYGPMIRKDSGVYILPSNKYDLLPIKCVAEKGDSQAYEIVDMPQFYKEAETLGLITSVPRQMLDLNHKCEWPLFAMIKREMVKQIRNADRYSIINEIVMYYGETANSNRRRSDLTCRVADSLICDILPDEYWASDFRGDYDESVVFKSQCELILMHMKESNLIYDYEFIYQGDLAVGFIIHLSDEPYIETPDVIVHPSDVELIDNDMVDEIEEALLEMEELQYAMVSEQIRVIVEILGLKYVDSDLAKRLQTKIKLSLYKIKHLLNRKVSKSKRKK